MHDRPIEVNGCEQGPLGPEILTEPGAAADPGTVSAAVIGSNAPIQVRRRVAIVTPGTSVVGVAGSVPAARSHVRILGADDRIQIGQIGGGYGARGHRNALEISAETDPRFDVRNMRDLLGGKP